MKGEKETGTDWNSVKCRERVEGQTREKGDLKPEAEARTPGGWARSPAADLGVDVHLSRAEQQADHLQIPNFGCVVEAGGAVFLLRAMQADEPAGWHLKPRP